MPSRRINKFVKILMIIAMVAILVASLSACSIIDSLFKTADNSSVNEEVEGITVTAEEGLTAVTGGYSTEVGAEFKLKAVVSGDTPSRVSYKWYVGVVGGDAKEIEDATDKTLTYSLETFNAAGYEFYATANGTKSENAIKVFLSYAELGDVQISSSTDTINDGRIQQKKVSVKKISLSASWNSEDMRPDAVCTVAWYVGESSVAAGTETEFDYTPATTVGNTDIRVRVTCDEDYSESTVTVSVLDQYNAVESVSLAVESGATAFGSGAKTQYKQVSMTAAAVTLSADVYPLEGTDYDADVVWTVTDKNGTRTLEDVDREIEFTPVFGENSVTATVDNVVSKHVVIVFLGESEYNSAKTALEYTYVWREGVYNSYITSQDDLNVFIDYMASKRITTDDTSDTSKMYYYKSASYFTIDNSSLSKALNSLSEGGSFLLASYGDYMYFSTSRFDSGSGTTKYTVFANPSENYTPASEVTQSTNVVSDLKEIDETDRRSSLPIDSNTVYPDVIKNSDILYRAVGWGYKPTFDTSATGVKLKALYDEAREMLFTYISEDMTDYQKVKIIYEWIADKTDYDYAIVADTTLPESEKLSFNAFFLEGIFTDADGEGHGQGVCDARSKAFMLLCGMENITAVRITGKGKGENHAWNKVLLDANNDNVKEWYFCDPTWGDRASSGGKENLTLQYFLVPDSYVSTSHTADDGQYNPNAVTTINHYAMSTIKNGEHDFDLYIDSFLELNYAVNYSKTNAVYLDLKIAPSVAKNYSELSTKISTIGIGAGYGYEIYKLDESAGLYLILIKHA